MSLIGQSIMLQVDNMSDTIHSYESDLGFKCTARMGDDWANLQRDNISIMLSCRHGPGQDRPPQMTASIYLFTDSVDALWDELKDVTSIAYPIETFDFGMREFAIIDCNGYMIQFGQNVT